MGAFRQGERRFRRRRIQFVTNTPERILLIRPSALGDVCRTVPVLRSLRAAYPHARIDWLVRSDWQDAISAHPDLDGVVPFPRDQLRHPWKSSHRAAARMLRSALREAHYDLVLDAQGLFRSGLMAHWTAAPRRIGFADAREGGRWGLTEHVDIPAGTHAVDRMLGLLRPLGVAAHSDLQLFLPPSALHEANGWRQANSLVCGGYHVLAPCTRGTAKRWPLERWVELGQAIGGPCVVVGSPSDRLNLLPLVNALGSSTRLAAGSVSLGATMGLVAGAMRLVGLDSAPLHMASGFGVSALGLFGPTDPALTGPWRGAGASIRPTGVPSHVRYRHTDDRWMRQLSVDMVLDRLEEIPMTPRRLWLGSGSPQRRAMLKEAGYAATPRPPHLDDGQLTPGDVGPEEWTLALACWKARAVAESLRAEGARGVVLAGDTVCTHRGEVMGKPRNQDHARVMLQAFRNATHPVVTGVCLIDLDRDEEQSFVDVARVRWGSVPDEAIESYLQSDGWKGRAGGYNLADRISDGWDIACEGDPATVMGLPLQRLGPMLAGMALAPSQEDNP